MFCFHMPIFSRVTLAFFIAVGLLCFAQRTVSPGVIRFDEIAQRAGVDFITNSSPTPNKNQPETMVAGVALFDYDGDGLPDIYLVNGASLPELRKTGPEFSNRLFHNDGNLKFTDVTARAGVAGEGFGMGVAAADYDNDGHPDLFVANVTGNQLFHNNGDGTFTDVTARAGVSGVSKDGHKMWSVSAAWLDYNNDGLLDLFVTNYVKWEVNRDPVCGRPGMRSYCGPTLYEPLPNTLYRNNGDGTFTDVSEETGIAKSRGRGMGVSIADYDGDGWMDIFVANDNSPNQLFHNLSGKRFEEAAANALVALTEDGNVVAGMGADFRDLNNDGRPDIWFTALPGQTFPLFTNAGNRLFSNATAASGVGWQTIEMSGWSNGIYDFDNDGWKDLFVARSNVLDNIEKISSRKYAEPNAVLRNTANGKFKDVSATAGEAFALPGVHRGAAFGDLDNDGRVDAVVSVLNGKLKIFHNVTQPAGHWLTLRLKGVASNRDAIGARLSVTRAGGAKQYNHVTTSVGYACSSDVRVHFGLGADTVANEVEIVWPSGRRQTLQHLAADGIVDVNEPSR